MFFFRSAYLDFRGLIADSWVFCQGDLGQRGEEDLRLVQSNQLTWAEGQLRLRRVRRGAVEPVQRPAISYESRLSSPAPPGPPAPAPAPAPAAAAAPPPPAPPAPLPAAAPPAPARPRPRFSPPQRRSRVDSRHIAATQSNLGRDIKELLQEKDPRFTKAAASVADSRKVVSLQVCYEDPANCDCDGPKVTVKMAEPKDVEVPLATLGRAQPKR